MKLESLSIADKLPTILALVGLVTAFGNACAAEDRHAVQTNSTNASVVGKTDPVRSSNVDRQTVAATHRVRLSDTQLDGVTAGVPWWGWMAVGVAGGIVLDTYTDVIGEAGHGCRGLNCNNLP